MTALVETPLVEEVDDWREMPPDHKLLYAERMAVACAKMGIGLGEDPTPGVLAGRLDREYVSRAHLRMIDAAFKRVLAGEVDRVAINTPPQVGKSVLAGEWAPFWWLTHRPRDRIVLGSYADALARKRGRRVRTLVRDHGLDFGLELDPESASAHDWQTTSGGGLRAAGVGGSLTGMPGDFGVIDDPHKDRAEADSEEIRENVWDWYSSTFNTRLSPRAPVLLVMTRWHPEDLAGKLFADEGTVDEGGRWLVINLPAFAVDGDPLGRQFGDPLPHPKIPENDVEAARAHWEEKRRTSRPRDWTALYMCDPIDTQGALLTEEELERQYNPRPTTTPSIVAVAVDPSGGGRDNAGIVGGYLGHDGHCYWTDDRTARYQADGWGRAACELAAEIEADRIVVENSYGADMARYVVRTSWDALDREWTEANPPDPSLPAAEQPRNPYGGMCPRIVMVHAKRGKLLRAEPVAQQVVEGRVWLTRRMPNLAKEWLTWKPSSGFSPGGIDASVYLTLNLLRPPGSDTVVSTPAGKGPSGQSPIHRKRIGR